MAENSVNKSRRDAVRLMLGGLAAVPLANLVGMAAAQAEDLPHLTEDDPTAKGLQYVNDATKANRAEKMGVAASEQFCHSCMFIQAADGDWRPCQIFPGKLVNANGWCVSWTKKPG